MIYVSLAPHWCTVKPGSCRDEHEEPSGVGTRSRLTVVDLCDRIRARRQPTRDHLARAR